MNEFCELYEIIIGQEYYYFCNYPKELVIGGNKYSPILAERSEFTLSEDLEQISLNLQIALTEDISRIIQKYELPYTKIRIHLYEFTTDTAKLFFEGYLSNLSVSGNFLVLTFKVIPLRNVRLPKYFYQQTCNHILGDNNCKVDLSLYTYEVTITEVISDTQFRISQTFDDGFLTLGTCRFGEEERLIVRQQADIITIHYAFSEEPEVNANLTVIAGCDGRAETCKNKFNNFDNFLGFRYIPVRNPTLWGI